MVKATVEKREGHTAYLQVEVEAPEVSRALDRAAREIARRLTIPGFRPGRAPRGLVERRVGRDAVVQEALDQLLPQALARAVQATGVEPIDRARIEDVRFEEGGPLSFRAVVPVRPEVELPDYRALRVEVEPVEVSPDQVEQVLEQLREQQAALVPLEQQDRPAAPGDVVVFDYRGEAGGEPVPGARGEHVQAELGAGRLRREFEQHLLGMKPGETRAFELSFPEDDPEPQLRGKTVRFTVTLRELRRKELPPLDDEFARGLGADSLEELRREVQNRLEHRLRAEAERRLRARVVDLLVEGARVEVPELLVERRLAELLDELKRRAEAQGTTLESYLAAGGRSVEDVRAELRPQAERSVREELVLMAVARREGIRAGEADLQQEIRRIARGSGRSEAEVRRLLRHPEVRGRVLAEIVLRKTIDFLAEIARARPAAGGP